MFRFFFANKTKTIAGAAFIIASASVGSRVLGLLRDRILAGQFGAGDALDVYYAAFRLPDTIFNLLVLGALSAGFIPLFMEWREKKGEHESFHAVNNVLNVMFVDMLVLCSILFVFASPITRLITPGFDPEKLRLTVNLTRIMVLSPLLLSLSAVFGGVLQAHKRFIIYSFAPIFYNFGIIAGAVFLVPYFGLHGLAYGVVLGAFLHSLVQLIAVFSLGWRYAFVFSWKDEFLIRLLRLTLPRTLASGVSQVNFFLVTIFGSMISGGSIAVFHLAQNIQGFPLGVFAISIAIAAFPSFAESVAKKKNDELARSFSETARQILFFLIPVSAIFLVLRAQIIRVILGAGSFDWNNTRDTADALAFFAMSLFAQGLTPLLNRAFYALQDTKTPLYAGIFSILLNVLLSYGLIQHPFFLSHFSAVSGLVAAFSISQILNAALLWLLLRARLGSLHERQVLGSIFVTSVATLGLGMMAHLMKYVVEPLTGTNTFAGILLQGSVAGLSGLAVFMLIAWFLKSEELGSLVRSLRTRVFKTAQTQVEGVEEAE